MLEQLNILNNTIKNLSAFFIFNSIQGFRLIKCQSLEFIGSKFTGTTFSVLNPQGPC